MDFETFFDKECLVDVLETAFPKINPKEYRLLYKMNKERYITVLTPVGESNMEIVKEGLSQGTLESAPLSANSTDVGLQRFFGDSPYEIYHNNVVRIPYMGYQDDILRASKNLEDTQAGITKLEAMAESKLLNFNGKKSFLILTGNENKIKDVEEKLLVNPIKLYGRPMKVQSTGKFLGDQIGKSVSDSVTATINKRKGTTLLAINDITTIVNDARANVIGGIKLAIDIWELAIIPFLLNNGGTWTGIDSKGMEILDDLQKTFMKRLLKVKTASIPLMLWDLKQDRMKNRIMKIFRTERWRRSC